MDNEKTTYTLKGQLTLRNPGEAYDILHCGSECVAEWGDMFDGKQITLRYWTADKDIPAEDMKLAALGEIMGRVDAEYEARYSEITGYLWTDEDFKVGGHDMIQRLKSEVGRYLYMEVEVEQ